MNDAEVVNRLFKMAEDLGATSFHTHIAHTDVGIVLVDSETGKTYRVRMEEF